MSTFGRQHYNAIAKDIRTEFGDWLKEPDRHDCIMASRVLTDLAMRLATRFMNDNELFDPVKFLTACSPDENLYPLGELWPADYQRELDQS